MTEQSVNTVTNIPMTQVSFSLRCLSPSCSPFLCLSNLSPGGISLSHYISEREREEMMMMRDLPFNETVVDHFVDEEKEGKYLS